MKELRSKMNHINLRLAICEENLNLEIENKLSSLHNKRAFFLYTISLLTTVTLIYALWIIHDSEIKAHLTDNKLKNVVQTIITDDNEIREVLTNDDMRALQVSKVHALDENNHLSEQNSPRNDPRNNDSDVVIEDEAYLWVRTSEPRRGRRLARSANQRSERRYANTWKSRFVNCARFRPESRGKYLASASLRALDLCYRHGVYAQELERGISRNQNGLSRYDLDRLYIACEDVFDEGLDDLTDGLKDDYQRCKWTGVLSQSQQKLIDDRFAEKLVSNEQMDSPLTPSSSTTVQSRVALDPRSFIECSHVETELFEDYFESPSYDALKRCEKVGVTAQEIEQGIARNPRPEKPRYDVSDLYISCMEMFAGNIDYMTNELKDDYYKCKQVGAITRDVQQAMETKFYDTLANAQRRKQRKN